MGDDLRLLLRSNERSSSLPYSPKTTFVLDLDSGARDRISRTTIDKMRSAILSTARPALSLPRAVPSASRGFIAQFPAPETVPKEGETNQFTVRADSVISNPATVLRLVRALEKELGTVVRIDMPKDQDMRRGFKFMSVETLRPRALPEPLSGELPASYIDAGAGHGGVSLGDVLAALRSEQPPSASTEPTPRIAYEVIARTEPMRFRRGLQNRATKPTLAQRRADSDIVAALRAFDGGFFGGFAGVADKFAELELPPPAEPPTHTRPKGARAPKAAEAEAAAPPASAEEQAETGPALSFAEIVAEQRAAKADLAAGAAKKAQAAEKPEQVVEQPQTKEPEVDLAAQRMAKLQQRAIERARKAAEAAKETAAAEAEAEAARAAEAAEAAEKQQIKEQEQAKQQEPPKKKGWF